MDPSTRARKNADQARGRDRKPPSPPSKVFEGPLRRDRTDFPSRLVVMLKALYRKYVEAKLTGTDKLGNYLKYYQYLVRAFMTDPDYGMGATGNARGLLIYHSVGMGKTLLAVACMLALWDSRDPVVLAPRSLRGNFEATLRKAIGIIHAGLPAAELKRMQDAAVARVKHVSMDAYNAADQMTRVGTGRTVAEGTGSLDNKVLIVDEAHNFSRAIINSPAETANARRLYDMIMEARNMRALFLSGTPAAKDPFELVPIFNMIAGTDLLPSQYEVFYRLYVDKPARRVKNRAKLANRLMGLVSHVTPSLPTEPPGVGEESRPKTAPRETGGFPEELATVIERVEMAPEQYKRYLLLREKEDAEGKGGEGGPRGESLSSPALSLPGSEKKAMRSYFVKSRSMSNFAPPRGWNQSVEELPDDAFSEDSAPKAVRMIKRIEKAPGSVLVYSQFRELGGLKVIARFLKLKGYSEFVLPAEAKAERTGKSGAAETTTEPPDVVPTKTDEDEDGDESISVAAEVPDIEPAEKKAEQVEPPSVDIPAPAKRYAIISGEVLPRDRLRLQAVFNSKENVRGAIIHALLLTKSGAEGLDLKNIRQTHQYEPYWDKNRDAQFIGRAVRLGSHDDLPPQDRDVQPFLYISVANSKVREATPAENREDKTIDEKFHERALERFELIQDFRRLLRSVSLECALFRYPNSDCRMCVPTGEPLFYMDPAQDVKLADPCEPLTESDVEATPITVTGKDGTPATYFYVVDPSDPLGYKFYEHSEALGGYALLDPSDPIISRLLKALLGEED